MLTILFLYPALALGNVLHYRSNTQCLNDCGQALRTLLQAPSPKSMLLDGCSSLLGTTIIPIKATATSTTTTTVTRFNNNGIYNPTIEPLIKQTGAALTTTARTTPDGLPCLCHCVGATPFVTTLSPVATALVTAQIPTTISTFHLKAVFANGTSTNIYEQQIPQISDTSKDRWELRLNGTSNPALFQLMPNKQLQLQSQGVTSWTQAKNNATSKMVYFGDLHNNGTESFTPQSFHIAVENLGNSWKYTLRSDWAQHALVACNDMLNIVEMVMLHASDDHCALIEVQVVPQY